jgi:hypothetical protein
MRTIFKRYRFEPHTLIKTRFAKITTGDGIVIEFNTLLLNAHFSIRSSREPVSKVTVTRGSSLLKLYSPKRTTDNGMAIENGPLPRNANAEID